MSSSDGPQTLKASVLAETEEAYQLGSLTPAAPLPDAVNPVGRGAGSGGAQYLVVGAGLSGATVAREAAERGTRVLVIDKRAHTGGNCWDYIDKETGFRMAEYGPHFFHTASSRVWSYVNRFSEWTPWEHRVVARVGEAHVPVPCNITTVNTLFGAGITDSTGMDAWLAAEQIPCTAPRDSRDVALSRVGSRLYDLLFRGYTRKQWAKWPEELEASVLARIPVRNNFDDRYFTDPHQALPRRGYAAFLAAMLDHPNIEVRTGVDYFAERDALRGHEKVFYTGPIDRYFAHLGYDPLEYRTVTFDRSVQATPTPATRLQPASQVNYPDPAVAHTRITEYKHLPNQETASGELRTPCTVLMTEFSSGEGEPYYPVPAPANRGLYEKYRAAAAGEAGVVFVGRLASYKYFNMDQAILNGACACAAGEEPLAPPPRGGMMLATLITPDPPPPLAHSRQLSSAPTSMSTARATAGRLQLEIYDRLLSGRHPPPHPPFSCPAS